MAVGNNKRLAIEAEEVATRRSAAFAASDKAEASTMTTRAKKVTIDTRDSKGIARIKSKGGSTSYAACVYKALTRGELMLLAAQATGNGQCGQ